MQHNENYQRLGVARSGQLYFNGRRLGLHTFKPTQNIPFAMQRKLR